NALNVCLRKPSLCDSSLVASFRSRIDDQRARELQAHSEARIFAVIIGISKYQNGRMPRVDYADIDAMLFANYVQTVRAARPENIFLLVNEGATAKRIREALEVVLAKASARDTVYVFVSAHGLTEAGAAQDGFLMGYDSDPQEMQVTAYRFSELRSALR